MTPPKSPTITAIQGKFFNSFLAKLRGYTGRATLRNRKITLTLDMPTQELANLCFTQAYAQMRDRMPRNTCTPPDVPPIPERRIEKVQSKRDALMVRSKPAAKRSRASVAAHTGEGFYRLQERIATEWQDGDPLPAELIIGEERTARAKGSHTRLPSHQQLRSSEKPTVPGWLADLVGRKR